MRISALIISSLFHPVFVPLIGFLLLYFLSGYTLYLPENIFWFSILVIIQFTILIPVGSIYYLFWRKKISSINLSQREDRPLPLVINLISYSVAFLIFRYLNYPHIIISFFSSIVLASTLSMLISFTYKISLHMVAWGTLTGIIIAFALKTNLELHFITSIIVLLTGFIASARLWLNEHNIQQIAYAWVISSLLSFTIVSFI